MFFRNCFRVGIYDQGERMQVVGIQSKPHTLKSSCHTLLHVLGMYHEHQRPDRDQYITVEWKNIRSGN